MTYAATNKELTYYYNDMDKAFRAGSDHRWPSFRVAMNLYLQQGGKRIVETGCARLKDDWGGGLSTVLLGDLCKRLDDGSHLWTVDLSPQNMNTCQELTEEYSDFITYTVEDSVSYLANLKLDGPIDLLYLDSYDYPYGQLLNEYGGQANITEAERILGSMTETEIATKHWDLIKGSQEHCVKELEAALPHCNDSTIILIDDNMLAGGGKPRLAKQKLIQMGYTCLYDWQQTLWIVR